MLRYEKLDLSLFALAFIPQTPYLRQGASSAFPVGA